MNPDLTFINELLETYVKLGPSPIHGIGVFAIRDIPKGCRTMFAKAHDEWQKIPITQVETFPDYLKEVIFNYCVYDDSYYYVERSGFKKMDISSFINHSEQPNLISINGSEYFEASRLIKCGEELLINYGELVDY